MSVKDKADAIDRFVRTLKSGGGLWDDINAACIMAGWTNLAGALTPLKGSAPTNGGGLFQNADLDPGIGLKGDGATKYLDSNRANNADGQDDMHLAAYVTTAATGTTYAIGSNDGGSVHSLAGVGYWSRTTTGETGVAPAVGMHAISRAGSSGFNYMKASGGVLASTKVSASITAQRNAFVFAYNNNLSPAGRTDATLSWYSIGSATDLAALDSAVSTLMSDLRAIDEQGFEPESVNYLRAVEAADGSFLESGVKKAINSFIVGLKKDNLWDAIKSSCILCGARTIAGALVPLAGTAPTAVNFVSANYNRQTGLIGVPASNTYIDTNRANNADGQNDHHMAVHITANASSGIQFVIGAGGADAGASNMGFGDITQPMSIRCRNQTAESVGLVSDGGFFAASRSEANAYVMRGSGVNAPGTTTSQTPYNGSVHVFRRNASTTFPTDARLAFYSIGSAISDLSLLDNRVSTLVSQIAAAIP